MALPAQITVIPHPFTGEAEESWEEFPVGFTPTSLMPIFDGAATISSSSAYVWMNTPELGIPGGMGLGPFTAKAYDGTQGYASSAAGITAEIIFNSPVLNFGGYWGNGVGDPDTVFTFFDNNGAVIWSDSFHYVSPGNDGSLQWRGWHSEGPIHALRFSGYWVVNDSLRLSTVPEPSAGIILLLSSAILMFARGWRIRSASIRLVDQ